MTDAIYKNGNIYYNGFIYSPVKDSLISKMVAVDKNIYSIKFFGTKLPKELQDTLAGTCWIRVDFENKKSNNNLVTVGL